MKPSLFILALSLLISCGKQAQNSGNESLSEKQFQEADDRPAATAGKYSSVSIGFESFLGDVLHQLHINLGQSPVVVSGSLRGNENNDEDGRSCSFQISVSPKQSEELNRLAQNLKTCVHSTSSDIQIEANAYFISLNKTDGQEVSANRDLLGMNGEEYLCRGKNGFYAAVKEIVRAEAQKSHCPGGALNSIFN